MDERIRVMRDRLATYAGVSFALLAFGLTSSSPETGTVMIVAAGTTAVIGLIRVFDPMGLIS